MTNHSTLLTMPELHVKTIRSLALKVFQLEKTLKKKTFSLAILSSVEPLYFF